MVGLIGPAGPGGVAAAEGASWRVRADHTAPLNADAGWAGALNEEVTVVVDRPFRVRFEWERPAAVAGETGVILQYRRNGHEDWFEVRAHDFPYPEAEEPRAPRLSGVSTPGYVHGEPAADLLGGSRRPFVGGVGVNLAGEAPVWLEQAGHVEVEWPLVIRRWADGAETTEEGDRYELRLADSRGTAVPGAAVAAVRATIPPGHVGGTFVETPGRVGPWRTAAGDLYFVMEPTESDNVFMVVKSTDGGRTWQEVDGANRPRTGDLESVDGRLVGDTLFLLHQITERVVLHVLRTADHPVLPDTWALTDEVVDEVESIAQAATLVARSDGSFVALYVGSTVHHATRTPAGKWTAHGPFDPAETRILAGPQAVRGADDEVHVVYWREDGTIWHRMLQPDGEVTPAMLLADGAGTSEDDFGSVLPLVYLPDSDTLVAVYRLADGRLWERRISGGGAPRAQVAVTDRAVVQHAVDAQQPGADVVADGGTVHVLFIDDATRDLWHTFNAGSGWTSPQPAAQEVNAQWVRGLVSRAMDGGPVYRFVYDAGSNGGGGMNRYGELPLDRR